MLWREVGTQDFIHHSVIVSAKASVKVKAPYNASQRHGMVMTSSMGKYETEQKRLDPAATLLLYTGLQ